MSNRFKIVIIVFIYLIFLGFTNNVQANENCKLYIQDITKYVNSNNVVVNIYMENVNTQITTLGLNLEYDNSKLKFISSKAGKDLHATVKLVGNMQEKGKVSIGALALDGFKNNGLYYSITFQVLDDRNDIPIKLSKREITDKDGNAVDVETQGTTIKISKETTTIERSPENQKIESFEVEGQMEYNNLDTYIQEQGQIKILGNDTLVYEIENNEIIEVQDDGTIIPIKDGTTNVRVKLNNDTIGNVIVEVESKEIQKISATDEIIEFLPTSSSQDIQLIEKNIEEENQLAETISIEKEKKITNEENKRNWIIIIIILFLLIVCIIFTIKKNKNKNKS